MKTVDGRFGIRENYCEKSCVFTMTTGPETSRQAHDAGVNTLEKSCILEVNCVQLHLLLLFNQGWFIAVNVASH